MNGVSSHSPEHIAIMVSPATLEQIAMVKIALQMLKNFKMNEINFSSDWWNVKNTISDLISRMKFFTEVIELPETLKKNILNMIPCLYIEVINWIKHHETICDISLLLHNIFTDVLQWTSQASIDSKKTAKGLMNYQGLPITDRFKIACVYCFEDFVTLFYPQSRMLTESDYCGNTAYSHYNLIKLWADKIKKSKPFSNNDILNGFTATLNSKNIVGVKFFWEKLPYVQRQIVLNNSNFYMKDLFNTCLYVADKSAVCNVFEFLISQMTEKQILTCLSVEDTQRLLASLIHWPHSKELLNIFQLFWKILSSENVDVFFRLWLFIINVIINTILSPFCDYFIVLKEFYIRSPQMIKEYAKEKYPDGWWINKRFEREEYTSETVMKLSELLKDIGRIQLSQSNVHIRYEKLIKDGKLTEAEIFWKYFALSAGKN